jgi:hypothetical protein
LQDVLAAVFDVVFRYACNGCRAGNFSIEH